ncbi:hypothetical protein, partial [Serratia fonticola]|uniref:hypothetical protein n=1 Tax=Serratia fonticola TaxID=47917 RepID=UPI0034C611DB
VKGVERQPTKPATTAFTDFIKIKLYTFLYTFVFAWAKFAYFSLSLCRRCWWVNCQPSLNRSRR